MIYITGDTHGEFCRIERFRERAKPARDDATATTPNYKSIKETLIQ